MAKYVPDSKTQRWVVIAPSRTRRPHEQPVKPVKPVCPFCLGNESLTPPEVYRIGSGEKDKEGWKVRVVPNKFPITDIHEVIIHSPDHDRALESLSIDQVERIVMSYRDRFRAYENDGQVLIFCNQGLRAGASLSHPHSQLVVVPKQINLDAVSLEPFNNVVSDTDGYTVYCPDFSQWPFEVWIAPTEGNVLFGDISDGQIIPLAHVLQGTLKRIETVLKDPELPFKQVNEPFVYNYYIYHGQNWFIRIIPRAVHRAGFELGTGLSVNIVDPTEAANRLRAM